MEETIFNRLLIIDGNHALHRILSIPNNYELQNSEGIKTGGVFGLLKIIIKQLKTYNYYPVVVFDCGLSKRRLEVYPNYKRYQEKQLLTESVDMKTEAQLFEEEFKANLNTQITLLKEILPLFGIPVIQFDGWEGDDLIYILTKISKNSIVISDDKDLLQLIKDNGKNKCRVRRDMREEFWDINTLKENNLDAKKFILVKAIIGDPSDNIPSSCYGVGEKTADGLLEFYQFCKSNNIEYPESEEALDEISKKHKLSKRKAYINFSENQFLTNLLLTDLSLVDNDLNENPNILKNISEYLNSILTPKSDEYIISKKSEISDYFKQLNIETIDIDFIFQRLKNLENLVFTEDSNIDEIIEIKRKTLF